MNDNKQNFTFKIQESKIEKIKEIAKSENLAPSTYVRKIILDFLSKRDDINE